MLDTIQRMSHKVRKAYGYSNLTYGGDTITKIFRHFMMGISQGNGCATQLWSIIIYIAFLALLTQGFSIHFVNSFTAEIEQLVGFIFVDDCGMIQLDDDIEATQSQIKFEISEWEDLIRITGGCLAPDKSAWHLVDYECI